MNWRVFVGLGGVEQIACMTRRSQPKQSAPVPLVDARRAHDIRIRSIPECAVTNLPSQDQSQLAQGATKRMKV